MHLLNVITLQIRSCTGLLRILSRVLHQQMLRLQHERLLLDRSMLSGSENAERNGMSESFLIYDMISLQIDCPTPALLDANNHDIRSELRESLNTLSEIAHNSTRQLDTIYYSLLEKIGVLRSTIGSLQELSTVSNKLHHNFRDEVRQLEVDVRGQVDSFRGFNGQQERIEELDGRIKAGQDRVKGLSERLEECRKQAEAWEKREREWQARTSSKHFGCITCCC